MILVEHQLAGRNSHHIIEATFKAFARALRQATESDPRRGGTVPRFVIFLFNLKLHHHCHWFLDPLTSSPPKTNGGGKSWIQSIFVPCNFCKVWFFSIEAMEMTNGSNCRIELLLFYLNYFIYILMLELTTCFEIISLVHFIFGCYFLSWVL